MPALGVREGQPTDERRQLAVGSRPDDQVPVVRHQTVGNQPRFKPRDSLLENRLERFVITVVLENRQAGVRAIEHVINIAPVSGSVRSSHV